MKTKIEKIVPKVSVKTIIIAVIILIIVILTGFVSAVYAQRNIFEHKVLLIVAKTLNLPAVTIGSQNISIEAVSKNLSAMKKFYETKDYGNVGLRVDFSTPDGKKRLMIKERGILNKMLEDRVVMIISEEKEIKLLDEEVNKRMEDILADSGNGKNIEEDLQKNYGLTLAEFKSSIVIPGIYREELIKKAEAEYIMDNDAAKEKAQQAFQELNSGADFAETATKFSQGASAKNGGEIGWVKKADVIPELAGYLFSVNQPQKLQVIESDLGYHIAQVLEKKKSDNEDVVRVRQIFVRKKTFADWLDEKMKSMEIKVFLRGFTWNKEKQVIDFIEEEMKKFEQDDQRKFEGDASMV